MSQGNTSQLVQLHLSNQIKIQHNIGFLENANHQKTKKKRQKMWPAKQTIDY